MGLSWKLKTCWGAWWCWGKNWCNWLVLKGGFLPCTGSPNRNLPSPETVKYGYLAIHGIPNPALSGKKVPPVALLIISYASLGSICL